MLYLDTSFAGLILLDQEHNTEAQSLLRQAEGRQHLVSSALLKVELFRIARRTELSLDEVEAFLSAILIIDIDDEVLNKACTFTEELKSLDAIHLATAKILDSATDPVTVATYDKKLAQSARFHNLGVVIPGDGPALHLQ